MISKTAPAEQELWRQVDRNWQPLHGDIDRFGVSLQWHDFRVAEPVDWGRSFHRRSVEFCLNLSGRGEIGRVHHYRGGTTGYYAIGDEPLRASRDAGDHHRFVTVEFSRAHLRKQLSDSIDGIQPEVRTAVFEREDACVISEPQPITTEQRNVVGTLLEPPVPKAARALWYQSKALELMAHFLFTAKDPEFFCMRQKRVARERVERAKELIARDLANPPTLETIGQEVGCSPFYLSRSFSREVGLTIPQYLRKLRMERAAELLRTGRYNVTEAATEVGYSSLSHFSKAFCETIGCCPVLYPAAKNVILDR